MALKDLLVVVDGSAAAAARVDYAAALAERHDAHLTGLFTMPLPRMPTFVAAEMSDEIARLQHEMVRRQHDKAQKVFEDSVARAGRFDRAEWRATAGDPDLATEMAVRYADLVIAGQPDPDDHQDVGRVHLHALLLGSGRPVLVVPYAFRLRALEDRVVVAWNGSREAARAVADAMPVLEAAKQVTVLVIDPGPELGDEPGADITLHLARHHIAVEVAHVQAGSLEPGAALLSRAADLGADLIVMGAYGRPRLRELVLGGVTRHVLHHMTVPVLMSH